MNTFEKQQISSALDRCYGLAEAIRSDDILTYNEAVIELSRQSGLRYEYLLNNLDDVKAIVSKKVLS